MSNTIERKLTRLLTEAVEESEPAKVQEAFRDLLFLKEANSLTDPSRSVIPDSPTTISPYLYLYCAEAACRFDQWDIVKHCIERLQQEAVIQQQQQNTLENINYNNNNYNQKGAQTGDAASAPAWSDFSVRTLFCEANLAARGMIDKRGDELIRASKVPLAKMVRGVATAIESNRTVLAFAGVQQLWNIAQPLYKPGTCHVLADVFAFANKALDAAQVHDAELRSKWAMRLATCLNYSIPSRDSEAAAAIISAEQSYSTSRNIIPLARSTIAAASVAAAAAAAASGENTKTSSSGGGGGDKSKTSLQSNLLTAAGVGHVLLPGGSGGGAFGAGGKNSQSSAMIFDKNGNLISVNVPVAVARVLPILHEAGINAVPLSLTHGGVHPDCATATCFTVNNSSSNNQETAPKEKQAGKDDGSSKNVVDELINAMKDLTIAIQFQQQLVLGGGNLAASHNTGGKKGADNNKPHVATINAGPSTKESNVNQFPVVDGILEETLAECAFIAALLGVTNHEITSNATERCLVSRHHIARVYAELTNSVLQAQRCGGIQLQIHSDNSRMQSTTNSNSITNGLISAIRRIEITIEGALRVQDELLKSTIVERCVTTMWNLSLPLLNSNSRLSMTKSFKVAAQALQTVGSTNNVLISLLEHEIALHEVDQHFTAKAVERLDKCLKLDVTTSVPSTSSQNSSPQLLVEQSFLKEHERWMRYQLKGLQIKKDLYTKHSEPESESLRVLHQAIDTVPDARPPILARVMSLLEDQVSPLSLVLKNNDNSTNAILKISPAVLSTLKVPSRVFPTEVDSWNIDLVCTNWQSIVNGVYSTYTETQAALAAAAAAANNANDPNAKKGSKSAQSSPVRGAVPDSARNNNNNSKNNNKSAAAMTTTTTATSSSSSSPDFTFTEAEIAATPELEQFMVSTPEQQEALVQQQWERTQMWSTLRSCAWSFPSAASLELVRRVSETLLQLPSSDREIIIEQIRAALSHAETHIYEVRQQLGLRFGQFELTATSPEELYHDVKNFQRAIEATRNAEHSFLTLVVAASYLSHHIIITRGNKEERWTMLNCAISLWEAFRESFEENLYVLAFPAFQKMIPLFIHVLTNGGVALSGEVAQRFGGENATSSSSTGKGGNNKDKHNIHNAGDNNNNNNNYNIEAGFVNPANEPSGNLPQTFETSLVSHFGVAAVRSALQRYLAECLKIVDNISKSNSTIIIPIGDLRRIATADFTRLGTALTSLGNNNNNSLFQHDPSSPLLATASQWCESLIPLCSSADARELCKLSVVIRRYQGKLPEQRTDPVLQITTLIELADAAASSEERSLALVQAVELLQQQSAAATVELCSRVADACVRYPGCERLCIATCAIGQDLYRQGKLGKPNKVVSLSNNHDQQQQQQPQRDKKTTGSGKSNNTPRGAAGSKENSGENHKEIEYLEPDAEDWMFFALMLQCQGCASARLSSSSSASGGGVVDAATAEKILLRSLENLANSAAAGTRVVPAHRLMVVAKSVSLFKSAAEELVSVSHGSSESIRAMLPALRVVLSQPILNVVGPIATPSLTINGMNAQQQLQFQQQLEMLQSVAPSLVSDLSRLMLLMVKALHLKSLAEEGLAFLLSALKVLPSSEHKAFWDLDAAMRCSTGTPLNSTLLRVKEYDVHTQAQVWAAIARNARNRPDQLFALSQTVKCFNPQTHPLEHATHLVALANWLMRFDTDRGVSLSDIRTMMMRAIDIVWRDFSALIPPASAAHNNNNSHHRAGGRSSSSSVGTTRFSSSSVYNDHDGTTPRSEYEVTARSVTNYGGFAVGSSRASSAPKSAKGASSSSQQQQANTNLAASMKSGNTNIDAIRRCSDAKSLIALLECITAYTSIAPLHNNNNNNSSSPSFLTRTEALIIAHACVVSLWKNTINSINPMLAREAHLRDQRELREQIQTEMLANALDHEGADAGSSGNLAIKTSGRKQPSSNNNNKRNPSPNNTRDQKGLLLKQQQQQQQQQDHQDDSKTPSEVGGSGASQPPNQQSNNANNNNSISVTLPPVRSKATAFVLPSTIAGWCGLQLSPTFGAALLRLKENETQPISFFTVRDPTALCCALERIQDFLIESEMESLAAPVAALEEVLISYLWSPSHSQQVALHCCDMKRRALAVGLGVSPISKKEVVANLRNDAHKTMSLLGSSFSVIIPRAAQARQAEQDEENNTNTKQEENSNLTAIQSSVSTSSSSQYAALSSRWVRIIVDYYKLDRVGAALLSVCADVANLCKLAEDEAGMNRAMILAAKILHNQGQAARTVQVLHGVSYTHLRPQEMIDGKTEEASALLQLEDVPAATSVLDSLNFHINQTIVENFKAGGDDENQRQQKDGGEKPSSYYTPFQMPLTNLALRQFIQESIAPELQFLFVTKAAQTLLRHSSKTRLRAAICDALYKYVVATFGQDQNSSSSSKISSYPPQWKLAAQLLWLRVSSTLKQLIDERTNAISPANTPRSGQPQQQQQQQNSITLENLPYQTEHALQTIQELTAAIAFDFDAGELALHHAAGPLSERNPIVAAVLSASSPSASTSTSDLNSTVSARSLHLQRAFGILSEEITKLSGLRRKALAIYRTLPHVAAITYPTVEGAEKAGLGQALSSFMRSTKRTRRAEAKIKATSVSRAALEKQRELVRQERMKEVEARRSQRKLQEDQAAFSGKKNAAAKKFGSNAIPANLMSEVDFGFTPLDRTCGIPSPDPSDSDDESLDEDSQSDDDREVGRACEEVLQHKVITASSLLAQREQDEKLNNLGNKKKKQQQQVQRDQDELALQQQRQLTPALTSWAQSTLLALNAFSSSFASDSIDLKTPLSPVDLALLGINNTGDDEDADEDEHSEVLRHLALPARLLHHLTPDDDHHPNSFENGESYSSNYCNYLFSKNVDGLGNNNNNAGGDNFSGNNGNSKTGGAAAGGNKHQGTNKKQQQQDSANAAAGGGKQQQQQQGGNNSKNTQQQQQQQNQRQQRGGGASPFGTLGGKNINPQQGSPNGRNANNNVNALSMMVVPGIASLGCNTERTGLEYLEKVIAVAHSRDRWRLLGSALGLYANALARDPNIIVGLNEAAHENQVAKVLELSHAATIAADIKKLWKQLVHPSCAERVVSSSSNDSNENSSSRMTQRLRLAKQTLSSVITSSSSSGSNLSSYPTAPVFASNGSTNNDQEVVLPASLSNNQVHFLTITRAGGAASRDSPLFAVLRRGLTTVDLRISSSINSQQVKELITSFANVARQRQNVLAKPSSSASRSESLAVAEATFKVAMAVFAQTFSPLLGDFELAFSAFKARSTNLPQLVLCLDMEFQALPWEKLSFFHHHQQQQYYSTSARKEASGDFSNNNQNDDQQQGNSSSPSYFKSIVRDLSFYHCVARQVTWKKFEISPGALSVLPVGANQNSGNAKQQQQQQQGGGQSSGKGNANNDQAAGQVGTNVLASYPNGVCMAIVGEQQSGSSFDLASDSESRPRGYLWRHVTSSASTPSPFDDHALSQVESWFARTIQGAETGTLQPTSILYSSSGRFPFIVRSSLWASMDLTHVRAAYLLDNGATPTSSVIDEAAMIKSATASIESPHVVSLLMLARGVEFVISPSYGLPLTVHSSLQLSRLVTRIAGGEIGVDKTSITSSGKSATATDSSSAATGGASKEGGNKTQQGSKSGSGNASSDPVQLSLFNSQSSAAMARGMSELVHFAIHCQPILYAKQQSNTQQPSTTGNNIAAATPNQGTKKQNDSKSNNNNNQQQQQQGKNLQQEVEKPLDLSESESSCIALWGAVV